MLTWICFGSGKQKLSREICVGLKEFFRRSREAGRRVPLEDITPWKMVEDAIMLIAIAMLEK